MKSLFKFWNWILGTWYHIILPKMIPYAVAFLSTRVWRTRVLFPLLQTRGPVPISWQHRYPSLETSLLFISAIILNAACDRSRSPAMADLPEDCRNSSHSSKDPENCKDVEESVHSAANGTESSSASGYCNSLFRHLYSFIEFLFCYVK